MENQPYSETMSTLYGDLSLYKVTDDLNIELATAEAQLHLLNKEIALLENEYNDQLPYESTSHKKILYIADILNQPFLDESTRNKFIALILDQWKRLNSSVLPDIRE